MTPTLSQIRSWDTEHLAAAAQRWTSLAHSWVHAVTKVEMETSHPGGTVWDGHAADAARTRARADRMRVVGLADGLAVLASTAQAGASSVRAAQQRVLSAVAAANEAGFDVREDLSVVSLAPADRYRAQVVAANVQQAAAALSAADTDLATRIAAASAVLDNVSFSEAPVVDASPADMYSTGGQSDWSINCVASLGGGWDCYFRIDGGYTEHFYVPPA